MLGEWAALVHVAMRTEIFSAALAYLECKIRFCKTESAHSTTAQCRDTSMRCLPWGALWELLNLFAAGSLYCLLEERT